MKYEIPDYGDWRLNVFHWIGIATVAVIVLWKMPRPWNHVLGVSIIWFPIVALQFMLGRTVFGVILIIIALAILKSVWNDD
ncbi:hypothetical protein BOW37_12535 [Solemya velum gill symbiont]|nr:hypothetical protein BOW37_12535 [Solemya velum gill symbiont]OOZ47041.1 hypothetical protein BOW38_04260 [Solemya velum gill symbiont]OOZ52141.1 hypothetical protein BOW40_03585 [Solemya velum gill symbiont]OOZ54994.1 hypothetical protein BOW41_04800 [Solemya velum gill symbiont]OOZ56657.1 hypothetical protein BOW42_06045 [Solemya velum gill symbiont]